MEGSIYRKTVQSTLILITLIPETEDTTLLVCQVQGRFDVVGRQCCNLHELWHHTHGQQGKGPAVWSTARTQDEENPVIDAGLLQHSTVWLHMRTISIEWYFWRCVLPVQWSQNSIMSIHIVYIRLTKENLSEKVLMIHTSKMIWIHVILNARPGGDSKHVGNGRCSFPLQLNYFAPATIMNNAYLYHFVLCSSSMAKNHKVSRKQSTKVHFYMSKSEQAISK